jgi:hypothetical protein
LRYERSWKNGGIKFFYKAVVALSCVNSSQFCVSCAKQFSAIFLLSTNNSIRIRLNFDFHQALSARPRDTRLSFIYHTPRHLVRCEYARSFQSRPISISLGISIPSIPLSLYKQAHIPCPWRYPWSSTYSLLRLRPRI